jgi:hypothetical protein
LVKGFLHWSASSLQTSNELKSAAVTGKAMAMTVLRIVTIIATTSVQSLWKYKRLNTVKVGSARNEYLPSEPKSMQTHLVGEFDLKICKHSGKQKSRLEFGREPNASDRLKSTCKRCLADIGRAKNGKGK